MKARERDYQMLEGKEVDVLLPENGGFHGACIVDGCDYDVGITLSDKSNRKRYILCLNGPSGQAHFSTSTYPARFFNCVRGIKKGFYDATILGVLENSKDGAPMTECPFT